MKLDKITVALAVAGAFATPAAWAQDPTEPPPYGEPELPAEPVEPQPPAQQPPAPAPRQTTPKPPAPPKFVGVEPTPADAQALTTSAASAEISGNPQQALELSRRAIESDPRDPWPYYVRASAFARIGQADNAVKWFKEAEQRFAVSDIWARSVAIYGAAHALSEAGRCDEARVEFSRYASFIRERDPKSAEMAMRYAANCKSPAQAPSAAPKPSTAPEIKAPNP